MKVISLIVFPFFLISCVTGRGTLTVDGIIYRTGFYRDLSPEYKLPYIGDPYKAKGLHFVSRVNHEQFDLLYGVVYGPAWGDDHRILYINESQWEIARIYYANSDNFVYYCKIHGKSSSRHPFHATVTDIVPSKFDELRDFAEKIDYAEGTNYFGLKKRVETRRLKIFEPWNTLLQYDFLKESRDGIFGSGMIGFCIIEGKLLYKLDYDRDEHEMVVVDVPDELGQYFIELLAQFSL
jgi:hypothetical protein